MTRKPTIALAGLALLSMAVALSHCGGDSKKTLLLTDAAAAFSRDICTRAYACCTTEEMDQIRGTYWTDEASCVTYFTGIIEGMMIDKAEAAIAAGRGQYDAEVAGACEATFAARGCTGSPQNDFAALVEDCTGMYRGLQAADAPCLSDAECVPGTTCIGESGTTEGTCQAYLALGAACTPNSQPPCASGLYCDGAACATRKAAGAACAASTECAAGLECDANNQCATVVLTTCDGQ